MQSTSVTPFRHIVKMFMIRSSNFEISNFQFWMFSLHWGDSIPSYLIHILYNFVPEKNLIVVYVVCGSTIDLFLVQVRSWIRFVLQQKVTLIMIIMSYMRMPSLGSHCWLVEACCEVVVCVWQHVYETKEVQDRSKTHPESKLK